MIQATDDFSSETMKPRKSQKTNFKAEFYIYPKYPSNMKAR